MSAGEVFDPGCRRCPRLAGFLAEVREKHDDYHALPVGNAGNIRAYWKGYKEYKEHGKIDKLPVMIGFQAAGSAPIVEGRIIEDPKTLATAIKIGNPAKGLRYDARLALAFVPLRP